jgi:hypothetical protein
VAKKRQEHEHEHFLANDAKLVIQWLREHKQLVSYTVVLAVERSGQWQTVRLWDNSHGRHDMHRYTPEKQPATKFHDGTAEQALHAAIDHARTCWEALIASWEKRAV